MYALKDFSFHGNIPLDQIECYLHLVEFGLSGKFIGTSPEMEKLFAKYAKARKNPIPNYASRFQLLDEFCTSYESMLDILFAEDSKNFPVWKKLQGYRKAEKQSQLTLSGYFNKGSCVKILDSEKKEHKGIESSVFGLLMMPFVVNFFHQTHNDNGDLNGGRSLYNFEEYAKTKPSSP
eukprot:Nk52_evm25s225 gene=Nk52_evmTU25s225